MLFALGLSIRLDPLIADVWCNLGLAYFGLEDFTSAERAFRHAIALDGSHAASHTNLGNALISVLQPEEALLHLERGVELDQSSTHSLWNLALLIYYLVSTIRVGSTTRSASKMTISSMSLFLPQGRDSGIFQKPLVLVNSSSCLVRTGSG